MDRYRLDHSENFDSDPTSVKLDDLSFPLSAFEQQPADDRENRERDQDRPKHTVRTHPEVICEKIRERYLEYPKDKEIDPRRRPRIARAVECGFHHHSESVKDKSSRDDPQRVGTVSENRRFAGKERNYRVS